VMTYEGLLSFSSRLGPIEEGDRGRGGGKERGGRICSGRS